MSPSSTNQPAKNAFQSNKQEIERQPSAPPSQKQHQPELKPGQPFKPMGVVNSPQTIELSELLEMGFN
jgi:hypothetical protein